MKVTRVNEMRSLDRRAIEEYVIVEDYYDNVNII